MKRYKTYIVFFLFLIILSFFSCKKVNRNEKQMRNIIDQAGNCVEIPINPKRVVITSLLPLPSVYCLFNDSAKDIVGMHPSSFSAAKNSLLIKMFPELNDVSTTFVKNGHINIEELLNLNPDIILYNCSDKNECEIVKKSGIPAVGFSAKLTGYNCIESYSQWIKLLGEIYGKQEKAEKIIQRGKEIENKIKNRIEIISEENKPNVLIIFNYDNGIIKVSGKNFVGQYLLEITGGKNVASTLSGTPVINMEQIYKWNPDIIFITNFSPYQPEDLYKNKIENFDWSSVKAVQNKKVYKFPLGMYRWFPPSSETPLSLLWLATKIQPKIFSDINIDREIIAYYKEIYNKDLSIEDLYNIYNPSSKASGISK